MRRLFAGGILLAWAVAGFPVRGAASEEEPDEIVAIVSADVPGFSRSAEGREAFHDDDFKRNLARKAGERRRHEVVTRRDLVREAWGLLAGGGEPASPLEAAARRREAEKKALAGLIDLKILARAAIEQGFSISDREVDDEILGRLRRNPQWGVRDLAEFARRLAEEGDTLERYRREVREGLLATYYQQYNVRSVEIPPGRIAAYYAEHGDAFTRPAGVRLTRILVGLCEGEEASRKAAARAVECIGKLKAGGEASGIVREYSEDLETREAGGGSGFVEKGSYPAAVEAAAYAATAGEWLGPVEANGFLWIFRVDDQREAARLTLAEAQDGIRRRILNGEREKRVQELLARARKGVYVWTVPEFQENPETSPDAAR